MCIRDRSLFGLIGKIPPENFCSIIWANGRPPILALLSEAPTIAIDLGDIISCRVVMFSL